ncbi:MAG: hypothetical protein ACAH83_13575 [Alphaproteobacteria bacterium]
MSALTETFNRAAANDNGQKPPQFTAKNVKKDAITIMRPLKLKKAKKKIVL